ncbi:outer membrane protein assembly factor BamE [Erythrobacteraceae bacterium CFH 75059]|nr:outer membrane protein assembly factor BamE [Qipengyuania thermophila]TCD04135.1 outer membrane protein assembly factor BamE [Erythrobacteraceae bacterium CFH 75059]
MLAAAVLAAVLTSGCTSIRESRGYIRDTVLIDSIAPGVDNRRSVEETLGRPSFVSQFGQPTWFYVSSVTARGPFRQPRIADHAVLAITFNEAGNVAAVERSGMERVVFLNPDGARTPTVGRERGFLEDLFGNIGAVGAPGAQPPAGGGPAG